MTSTAPVTAVAWLGTPLQTDFVVGDSVRWYASFIDPVLKTAIDPDIVTFSISNPTAPATPTNNVYGSSNVVRDSAGNYHLDVPLTVVGKWLLNVIAQGNPGAVAVGGAEMRISVFSSGQ